MLRALRSGANRVVTCLEAQDMGFEFVKTCSRCDYYVQNRLLNAKALKVSLLRALIHVAVYWWTHSWRSLSLSEHEYSLQACSTHELSFILNFSIVCQGKVQSHLHCFPIKIAFAKDTKELYRVEYQDFFTFLCEYKQEKNLELNLIFLRTCRPYGKQRAVEEQQK
jgi:hypothetical protein